jgi:hypothetical protein
MEISRCSRIRSSDVALPAIKEEIKKRRQADPARQATDNVLRSLLAVTRKADAMADRGQAPESK